jgi:hypothetical protein
MKPAKGTTVTIVTPPNPTVVKESVNAAAGTLEQVSSEVKAAQAGSFSPTTISSAGSGSGSGSAAAPAEQKHQPDKAKKGWIEIVLKDEEGTPQGGTRYKITLPDGNVADGTLDDRGKARVDGFESGQCKIAFPDLDEKMWSPQ